MMARIPPFDLFGVLHLTALAVLTIVGAALLILGCRWRGTRTADYLAAGIGIFMILQEVADRGVHHLFYHEPFRNVLPLHLCGVSVFLTAAMLMGRSKFLFEILYFWGIAGASMAILTPDVRYTFPHFLFLSFFLSHALIIVGVAYMMLVYRCRPTGWSLARVLVITNLYMVFVALVDLLLGTNYLFLCQKPEGISLMDWLGPWPWYIAGLEAVGAGLFFLIYVPWLCWDYWPQIDMGPARESPPENPDQPT